MMRASRSFLLLCVALVSAALAGCTSVPQASRDDDAEAKQFLSHPGAATLYIYRPEPQSARMEESILYADKRLIGSLLARSFFRVDLRAGTHVLRGSGSDVGSLTIDTHSGEIYFISVRLVGGNSTFRLEDPDKAKQELLGCCALLENWAPGQRPLLR